jgi:hypothetical protein
MGVSNYGLLEITSSNPSRGGNKTFKTKVGCFVKQLLTFEGRGGVTNSPKQLIKFLKK